MTTIPLLLRLVLALGLVLGLIYGAVWLLRRYAPGKFTRTPALPVPLAVVGRTWLGQRREICAVRVADRLLLLGVTPMQVSFLSEIPNAFAAEAAELPVNAGAAPSVRAERAPRPAAPAPGAAASAAAPARHDSGFGAELADLLGGLGRQQARLRGEDV